MATRLLGFSKGPRLELAVFAICAVKFGITVAILKQKKSQMSLLQTLEFASSTLTDWMWTIIAAYVMLHYIGYSFCANPRAHRRGYASSTSSFSSRSSLRSISSIRSRSSNRSNRSIDSITGQRSNRSIDSVISQDSNRSIGSIFSQGSTRSVGSRISQRTTAAIVRHRTNIPNPMMERFVMFDDFQFEADMGLLQGTLFLDPVTENYLRRGIPSDARYWA
ncbi:uncharacterized protein DFL_003473 [Arthrobotrys flagrans]|uniref:Uncharacterized protein n=1 Tax=Arthrobotrys flagrans TaxID=97331 RepID=A0A437A207_ARTFL|nr:hypothetical protein DFL_003473 [Arthrobotrys flagrans]